MSLHLPAAAGVFGGSAISGNRLRSTHPAPPIPSTLHHASSFLHPASPAMSFLDYTGPGGFTPGSKEAMRAVHCEHRYELKAVAQQAAGACVLRGRQRNAGQGKQDGPAATAQSCQLLLSLHPGHPSAN